MRSPSQVNSSEAGLLGPDVGNQESDAHEDGVLGTARRKTPGRPKSKPADRESRMAWA
jgi:hypothetical protein